MIIYPKGGSNIKSIQRGGYTMSNTDQIVNITISSININKAIAKISSTCGDTTGNSYYDDVSIEITNSTTLTLTRGINTSGIALTIYWEVIEFSNVKSIQSGSHLLAGTFDSVTVSQYNMNKAMMFVSFYSGSNGSVGYDKLAYYPYSPTILYFRQGTAINKTIKWFLVEFL